MNLSEFRQQNPAYSDTEQWPDEKLADGLYNKFYSDMDRAEFDSMVAVDPREVQQAPKEKMNFFEGRIAEPRKRLSGGPESIVPDLGPKQSPAPGEPLMSTAPETMSRDVLSQIPSQVHIGEALKSTMNTWPDRFKQSVASGITAMYDLWLSFQPEGSENSAKYQAITTNRDQMVDNYKAAVEAVAENRPIFNRQPYVQFATEVAEVTQDMLPAIGGGLAFGPLMGPQAATLGIMGANAFGPAYMEGIKNGESTEQALFRGFAKASIEVLTETIPVAKLFQRGPEFTRRVLDMTVYEGAQEAVSSILSDMYDKETITPDMTLEEALSNAGYSFLLGAGAGGTLGTMSGLAHKAIEPSKRDQAAGMLLDLVNNGQIDPKVAEEIALKQSIPWGEQDIEPTGHMQGERVGPGAGTKHRQLSPEAAQQDKEDKAKIQKALEEELGEKEIVPQAPVAKEIETDEEFEQVVKDNAAAAKVEREYTGAQTSVMEDAFRKAVLGKALGKVGTEEGTPGVLMGTPEERSVSPPQEPLEGVEMDPEGNVTLHHYSDVAGLTAIDPAHHGEGIRGAEARRKAADPAMYPDRSYFYMDAGHKKEPNLGKERYAASVPLQEIYPLQQDPDGLAEQATTASKYNPDQKIVNYTKLEKLIKDAGYRGYWSGNPQLGKTVALFDKTPVTPRLNPEKLTYQLKLKGGYTVDPRTGAPKGEGFSVGIGLEETTPGYAKPEQIQAYQAKHADALARPDHYAGGWVYEGKTYQDVSRVHTGDAAGLKAAILQGKKNGEIGIQDLSKKDPDEGYIELAKVGNIDEFVANYNFTPGQTTGKVEESPETAAPHTVPRQMLQEMDSLPGIKLDEVQESAAYIAEDMEILNEVQEATRKTSRPMKVLTDDQYGLMDDLVVKLKILGLPDLAFGTVRGYMNLAWDTLGGHQTIHPHFGNKSVLGLASIELAEKSPLIRASMLQTLAHEVGHSVDQGAIPKGGEKEMASDTSPMFTLAGSQMGPIMKELDTVYRRNLMGLRKGLAYPMQYIASVQDFISLVNKTGSTEYAHAFLAEEAFAQLFGYYYTYGKTDLGAAQMQEFMPVSFEFMENIDEILRSSKDVAERDTRIRETFRTFKPGSYQGGAQRGQPGQEGAQGGQAGQAAPILQGAPEAQAARTTTRGTQPVTETPAFKAWFGDSKVVDENGEPLVVYHGTSRGADFTAFDTTPTTELGAHFGDSKQADAFVYDEVGVIIPAFLKIENPLRLMDAGDFTIENVAPQLDRLGIPEPKKKGLMEGDYLRARIKEAGYDGVVYLNRGEGLNKETESDRDYDIDVISDKDIIGAYPEAKDSYIVFSPTQIKSAIGNRGTFDLLSSNIDEQAPPLTMGGAEEHALLPQEPFEVPPERKVWDVVARRMQDKFQRLYVAQGAVRESGGDVDITKDPYAAEERMHGKIEWDFKQLELNHLEPLAEYLADNNIPMKDLDLYLYARHAPERNEAIAAKRADSDIPMDEGGSGMLTETAEQISADLEAQYGKSIETAAQMVWDMLAAKRRNMVDMSLIEQDVIDQWEDSYDHYVPLKGFADDALDINNQRQMNIGKGLSIKGKEFREAWGRLSMAKGPTAQAIADTTESIIRARKNEVGQYFLNLVYANPNPGYWDIYDQDNPDMAMQAGKLRPVAMHMDPKYFGVKIGGKQYYVKMNDALLARAMNNLGVEEQNAYVRLMGAVTRFLSSVNTSLNPEFVISNFSRDIQTAVLNVLAETDLHDAKVGGEKIAWKMVRDTKASGRSIYRALRNKPPRPGNEFDQLAYDFLKDGGKTGYFDSKDLAGLERYMNSLVQMSSGGALGMTKKMGKAVAEMVEDVNGAVENAVRLSAYINARKALEARGRPSHVARKKAAHLSKNLTVNFNRRGELSSGLNATWMFFNASVQGSAQFARTMLTLKKTEHGGRRLNMAQKAAAALTVTAYLMAFMNRWLSDEDEDERTFYDKIPGHVKERNLIVMKPEGIKDAPGDYWQIPLPYGYNIFYVLGTTVNDVVHGPQSAINGAQNITNALLGSFNPVGMSSDESWGKSAIKTAAPTWITPGVEIITNSNFFGGKIYDVDRYNDRTPESSLAFSTTKDHWIQLSRWMNRVTGGSLYEKGGVDLSPDKLEHWFEFATGGAGTFVDRAYNVGWKLKEGIPLKDREIPFLRKVNAQASEYENGRLYYERRPQALAKDDTYRALLGKSVGKKKQPADYKAARQYRKDHEDWFKLVSTSKIVDKQLKLLRKKQNAILVDESISEAERQRELDKIQQDKNVQYNKFNLQWNRLIEKD